MPDDMNLTGVYCIRNTISGKRYVGSAARSFRERSRKHRNDLKSGVHHSVPLQRSWDKHGEDAFRFEVVEICDPRFCVSVEQVMIDHYRSANTAFGYNVSPVAGSQLGVKFSDRARKNMASAKRVSRKAKFQIAAMAELNRGKIRSPETRSKISAANKGKRRSVECRERMSLQRRGKKRSPEAVEKTAAANRGRKASPEHIAKVAAANTGRKATPETLAKMSLANRGKKLTQEHRQKISDGLKRMDTALRESVSAASRARKRSPESLKKTADARRGQTHTDEAKEKIAASKRGVKRPQHVIDAMNRGRAAAKARREAVSQPKE